MYTTVSTFIMMHKKLNDVGPQLSLDEKVNLDDNIVDILVPKDRLPGV